MSRCLRHTAFAVITASLAAAWTPAQGNHGVIFSEVAYGPSLPPVGGNPMPSYVELVNIQIANPVIPLPVPIGTAAAGAASVSASVNGQPAQTFVIPIGFQLGGNVQGPPAAQPPNLPPDKPVLLLASAPFPAGVVPSGVVVIVAPPLFAGLNSQLGAPGVPFEICFSNPATTLSDRIHLGPPTALGCSGASFNNTNTFQPITGKAIRWTYVDSNTDHDFDPTLGHSPGIVNPQMTHVNGFFFGTTVSPALGGTPLNHGASATSGNLSFPPNARVTSIHFTNAFFTKTITDPAFDPIINAQVSLSATFTAQNPAISQPNFLPGLQIANETMTISANTPLGTGVLNMPMNISTQVGSNFGPSAQSPTDIRPERIFSDLVTDAGAFVNGTPTAAQIDVIPPSEGGGNTWCEIIVYDYQGNQYRAKVKNWPPGGACGGPLLALGTDGLGSCTLINLCFNPTALVANIFSIASPVGCGGPLIPPGGICPDATTLWIFTPPQLGALPFFATSDAAGMYLYQVPTGTLVGLSGTTFYGIGVEYTLGGTIVQQSPVNSILF